MPWHLLRPATSLMTLPLLVSAAWSFVLLGVYLRLAHKTGLRVPSVRRAGAIVVLVAHVARIVPQVALPGGASYDIESYQVAGSLVLRGEDVYANELAVNRHPYLPLQMYWMALAQRFANMANIPFAQLVKNLPIGLDALSALLLFSMLRRSTQSMELAFLGGLLFAVNPISVFVSAYHGQFDALPLFFILFGLWVLPASPLAAGGWIGLGILDKTWPVLMIPSFLRALRNWGMDHSSSSFRQPSPFWGS